MRYLCMAFLAILGSICEVNAQSVTDAISYSTLEVGGTARTIAIGGAIGALGGDFSVISTNPAGLAIYRTSEIVFTPGFNLTGTTAQLREGNNASAKENKNNFKLNNLGLVFSSRGRNLKTSNFAIGFNRIANYDQEFSYEGISTGSIARWFVELATDPFGNSIALNELNDYGSGLAFDADLLYDTDPTDEGYFWSTDFDAFPDAQIMRSETFSRKGSVNELVFAWAGNFQNRLMFGLSIGVPFLKDTKERSYKESDPEPGPVGNVEFFDNLEYTETLETKGVGVNFKLGMIYRVNQTFRLGASVHTPTRYSLSDEFINSLAYTYTFDGVVQGGFGEPNAPRTFDYKVITPWRVSGSAAAIIRKYGFLSAEIEWVNYAGTNFNLTGDSEDVPSDEVFQEALNAEIDNDYRSALNIRFGGEYAYKKFRLRAGYTITGRSLQAGNLTNNAYSFGLGLRENTFYIDLAYLGNTINGAV